MLDYKIVMISKSIFDRTTNSRIWRATENRIMERGQYYSE